MLFWPMMVTYLFGGWMRPGTLPDGTAYGTAFRFEFLTLRGARRYGTGWLSSIDPFAKYLHVGEIVPVYGKWFRRRPKSATGGWCAPTQLEVREGAAADLRVVERQSQEWPDVAAIREWPPLQAMPGEVQR